MNRPTPKGTRHHSLSCPSTSDLAIQAASAGQAHDRDHYTATSMTAARATNGNTWHAPPGGLWLSIITHNPPNPTHLWPAIAAANTLEIACNIPTTLKWPNDVIAKKTGKKIAGILIDRLEQTSQPTAILGIGINVSQTSFPPELQHTATSVALEAPVSNHAPDSILPILLDQLNAIEHTDLIAEFEKRSPITHAPITIYRTGKQPTHATAQGLTETGALKVRYQDGTTATLVSATDLDIRPRNTSDIQRGASA